MLTYLATREAYGDHTQVVTVVQKLGLDRWWGSHAELKRLSESDESGRTKEGFCE